MWRVQFAHPGLLYLATAAAVPVIIHLLRRRRVQIVHFPAVRFLRRSSSRRKTKTNLKHLLLLLMRMLLVALMAAVLARPFVSKGSGRGGAVANVGAEFGISVSAVIVIDDSLSMTYRRGGGAWFDRARNHALEILSQLPADSEAALTTTSQPGVQFSRDPAMLRARVTGMRPTLEATSCWPALEHAGKALRDRPTGARVIVLLTDLTRVAWPGLQRRDMMAGGKPLELGDVIAVEIVDCGEQKASNLAVTSISHVGEPALQGAVLKLDVELLSVGAPATEMVQFEFDDRLVRRDNISLEAYGTETWSVAVPIKTTGHQWGRVSFLNPDGLPQDNARSFALDAAESISVLCVDGAAGGTDEQSRSYFFRAALAPWAETERGIFRVTTVRPEQIKDVQLTGYDMIALVDTDLGNDNLWKRVADFVAGGGGLFVSMGQGAGAVGNESPAARKLLPAVGGEVFEAPDEADSHLIMRVVKLEHPVVDALADAGADLGRVPFLKCRRLELAEAAEEVLSFGPELPALVLSRAGGRVAVFSGGCQGVWSGFARQPEFVPFCQELALYLTGTGGGRLKEFMVGQHVPIRFEPSRWPTDVEVVPPGAEEGTRLMPAATPGRRVFWKTAVPGYYHVKFTRQQKEWTSGFAVNTAPAESDLRRAQPDELERAISAGSVRVHADTSSLAAQRGMGGAGMRQREITSLVVVLALALCLGEIFLANRIYRAAPADEQSEQSPT